MNFCRICIFTLLLLLLTFNNAYAYLDPNSGSLVLQILLGGLAGVAVVVKLYFQKIKAFFQFNKKDTGKND